VCRLIPAGQDNTGFLFSKRLFQNIIIDSGDKQVGRELDECQFPALIPEVHRDNKK